MTLIALLLRPWVMQMRDLNVTPRVLADDLMFYTHGVGHRARTVDAMLHSRTFFEDIGAKVAHNKCFTFASDSYTRKSPANMEWDSEGLKFRM